MKNFFTTFFFLLAIFTFSCRNKSIEEPQCYLPDIVPSSPYQEPVWHPNGNILGFNHKPLKGIGISGQPPCTQEVYLYNSDSSGFWLINKDGTNKRRVITFQLNTPAWSPEGKWIAFSNGGTIYKMKFDGNNFDTANIISLTNSGRNYFPSWSPKGDTIYFDSNNNTPNGSYFIWKMAADGGGKERIVDVIINEGAAREPFCSENNQVLHYRYRKYSEIFSMDTDGKNLIQITANNNGNHERRTPRFFINVIYFENNGIWRINYDGTGLQQISTRSGGYAISRDGTIAFVNFDYSKVDKVLGTIWLMEPDGSNKRQLTFNNY